MVKGGLSFVSFMHADKWIWRRQEWRERGGRSVSLEEFQILPALEGTVSLPTTSYTAPKSTLEFLTGHVSIEMFKEHLNFE